APALENVRVGTAGGRTVSDVAIIDQRRRLREPRRIPGELTRDHGPDELSVREARLGKIAADDHVALAGDIQAGHPVTLAGGMVVEERAGIGERRRGRQGSDLVPADGVAVGVSGGNAAAVHTDVMTDP